MATQPIADPFVTVQEYLSASYEPDLEYADGRLEDRNAGEHDHGYLQSLLAAIFTNHRKEWAVYAVTDVRTQIQSSKFRIPDVSVLRANSPREAIIAHPQLIAIEILSPEDRWSRLQEKIDDYLAFGVENIWILDPETRRAWTADRTGTHSAPMELSVLGTSIRIHIGELFAELDRA